jgi:hypothetical protein
MRRRLLLVGLTAVLSGCSDPRLNAGLSLGSDGLTVRPGLSAHVGGLTVGVSP